MGITKKQMEALARKHGVRGARDLVDRRRELPISDVLRRKLELAPCGSDAYPNSHIPMDVQETKQIHGILESAARFIGLHMTVVGLEPRKSRWPRRRRDHPRAIRWAADRRESLRVRVSDGVGQRTHGAILQGG